MYVSCIDIGLCSDCYLGNIMMDANELIPDGFHPRRMDRSPDLSRRIKPLRRHDLKQPIRYYYIDFGISSWFRDAKRADSDMDYWHRPADKKLRRLVRGNVCQDPRAQDVYTTDPYDPFLLDICILGDVFLVAFVRVSAEISFDYSLLIPCEEILEP
jgi:hypothetical protein